MRTGVLPVCTSALFLPASPNAGSGDNMEKSAAKAEWQWWQQLSGWQAELQMWLGCLRAGTKGQGNPRVLDTPGSGAAALTLRLLRNLDA